MLQTGWVWVVLLTVFVEGAALFGGYSFVGSFLKLRFGASYDVVGLIVAGFGVGGFLFAAAAPLFVRRFGEGGLTFWGGVILAAIFLALTKLPAVLAAIPLTVLAGLGFYMLHNTLQTNATQMAPEARGLAVSCFATAFFLGQSTGVGIAAPAFDYAGAGPLFIGAGAILFLLGLTFRFALKHKR
jgi:predicted MFS family arabinose efflux permease